MVLGSSEDKTTPTGVLPGCKGVQWHQPHSTTLQGQTKKSVADHRGDL